MKLFKRNIKRNQLSKQTILQSIRRSSLTKTSQIIYQQSSLFRTRNYVIRNYKYQTLNQAKQNQTIRTKTSIPIEEYSLQQVLSMKNGVIKNKTNQEQLSIENSSITKTISKQDQQKQFIQKQRLRLQRRSDIKLQQRKQMREQIQMKWAKDKKQRDFLKDIRMTKQQQKQRKNLNFEPAGLSNLGNTCYMNSVLQCLFNLPCFNQYFIGGKYLSEVKLERTSADSYGKLIFQMYNAGNNRISSQAPAQFKALIGSKNSMFAGTKQQDSTQFLIFFLQLMSKQLFVPSLISLQTKNPESDKINDLSQFYWEQHLKQQNSHVTKYFGGQMVSSIFCGNCNNSFQKFDAFYDIQLNFHKPLQSIEQMLQEFAKPQILNDYRCLFCDTPGKCQKKVQISKLPLILIIHLKRFQHTYQSSHKLKNTAVLPLQLNLSKTLPKNLQSSRSTQFLLNGYSKHYGQINSGHYTADCNHYISDKWYQFNDSKVKTIKIQRDVESPQAYVIFYVNQLLL